jgi:tRNA dimethylallyltransferase
MLPEPFQNCFVLTGPTGSGKTQLALELALRLDAEIVAMDSMTLYRGMDVGTAKPTPAERRQVPHHLIDVLEPWESASVAWWLEQARRSCAEIESRGKRVLFVGGTPLYLKALLCGLFDGPPADLELRRRLEEEAGRTGSVALHARLAQVDPPTAARLHPNDLRRIVRALEVWEHTGRPISSWQEQWARLAAPGASTDGIAPEVRCLWLDRPREELYDRINRRVVQMMQDGLVEEVRALRQLGRPLSREAAQALGYKELFAWLDGERCLEEAVALIQQRSRNFAKHQLTWFRHLPACRPVAPDLTFTLWGLTIHTPDQEHGSALSG